MEEALIKRILPHSIEAEQSVIGSMLMEKEAYASGAITSGLLGWSTQSLSLLHAAIVNATSVVIKILLVFIIFLFKWIYYVFFR